MDKTLKAAEFRDVFQHSLKINARTISVKTLLSERNLKRINYSPYYQRNYVWDNVKQTFFIESVILGTEIPPLILFKSGHSIEVIDGRQRFETLKRFKENDFSLTINGLKELQILNKKSFNKLSDQNKEIFLNSNIRVFEFEVINQPNLGEEIIDRVKKEIFRRYNTGITPLTKDEVDNAKYDEDEFSQLFKEELKKDPAFLISLNQCFFPKENVITNSEGLISANVDFIRRFRILNSFPISTYARGSGRTEIIDLLYDFAQNNTENVYSEFVNFKTQIEKVITIFRDFSKHEKLSNKLIYECLLWAITILEKEGIPFTYDYYRFKDHYLKSIDSYLEENSHYYRSLIDRYSDTAAFFKSLTGFDFSLYIKDEGFKKRLGSLKQTEVDAAKSIEELSNLRLHKPNPIATPIDEIRNDLKTSRYLIRPSYQRQEKINLLKASSIIESILLGINLPPIFVYKKGDIKEIVDGQQRLLAIIGFLGEQYSNEDGTLSYSKNNNYKLKGLKILTELEGRNFSALSTQHQDKILDFVIDLIVIEESFNENFDAIDLFIRLNYKPYPIKNNSFEMWNSIVNYEVINKIKNEVYEVHKPWFFLRETVEGRADRMENEELVTILSYIVYNNTLPSAPEVIGLFPRRDRITCRLKNKSALGDFLVNLDNVATEKMKFMDAIAKTERLISKLSSLFEGGATKENFNEFLNIKSSLSFRRSLQDFYVIWMIIEKIPNDQFVPNRDDIKSDIRQMISLLRNSNNSNVDDAYMQNFHTQLAEINKKYQLLN